MPEVALGEARIESLNRAFPNRAGAVDLQLLQKYINFWCSSSLDLFGNEISSNSAQTFANGLTDPCDAAALRNFTATDPGRGANRRVACSVFGPAPLGSGTTSQVITAPATRTAAT